MNSKKRVTVPSIRALKGKRPIGMLDDVDRTPVGEGPDRLGGVGKERRLAEQLLVPRSGRLEVPHA